MDSEISCINNMHNKVPFAFVCIANDYRILDANSVFNEMFGYNSALNMSFLDFIPSDEQKRFSDYHKIGCSRTNSPDVITLRAKTLGPEYFYISLRQSGILGSEENYCSYLIEDINENYWIKILNAAISGILEILSLNKNKINIIKLIISRIAGILKIDKVAIRLKEKDAYPYYLIEEASSEGVLPKPQCHKCDKGDFSPGCLCGIIINGNISNDKKFFTKWGSFFINSIEEINNRKTEGDSQIEIGPMCNFYNCNSVALIPLKSEGETVGLLQLNDRRKGLLSSFAVKQFEKLANAIGVAIRQKEAADIIKESQTRLKTALDTSNTGFLDWDISNDRIFLSPKLFDMLKLQESSSESFESSILDNIYDKQSNEALSSIFYKELQKKTQVTFFEIEISTSPENTRWYSVKTKPEFSDTGESVKRLIAVFSDITHQKENALEREKLIDRLKNALEKSKEANKLKTEFLSIVTHEIRTPLSSMMGFSQLLLADKNLPYDNKENVLYIYHSGQRLLNAINDILEISMLEAGNIKAEHSLFDIEEIVNDFILLFKFEIESKKLNFNIELNGIKTLYSDKLRVRQILFNLVGNAFKFTESGNINIKLKKKDKGFVFEISDTGIGIPKNMQEAVFESFIQAEDTIHRRYEGLGLGLTIAKKLSNTLGGDIKFESEEGKGSSFYFYLPKKKEKTGIKDILLSETDDLESKINIIFAEDDFVNHILIDKLLKKEKAFDVRGFFNGKELFDYLKTSGEKTDVVLLDISMPVMDGIECLEKIREENIEIPVLAMTAFASKSEKGKHLKMGFNDYITKPLSPEELIIKLKSFSQ